MALASLRLRRAIVLSSSFLLGHHGLRSFSASIASSSSTASVSSSSAATASPPALSGRSPYSLVQSLSFRSSASLYNRRFDDNQGRKIDPDEILFEGCDYQHWLITMDFPKDPAPTREEMIETYINTLAQVVGSVEEAKKRMYALSTTTYHGFQAVMSEEMSEKFRGLPGVVFILPDSYIDPVNKEYGGDKYENGVITPRPPPIQYGPRRPRPRYPNRNDQPNYNRPLREEQQGMMQGDGQNFRNPGPSYQRDFGQGGRGNFVPHDQSNFSRGPGYGGNYQRDFGQGDRGNFAPQDQSNFSRGPGYGGDHRQQPGYNGDHRQQPSGEYGQGTDPGYYGDDRQGGGPGHASNYRQGSGSA